MKTRLMCTAATILGLMAGTAAAGPPYGIDTRVSNTSLLINETPGTGAGSMTLTRAFTNLTFSNHLLLIESPDNSGRLFSVDQRGIITSFVKPANPVGPVTGGVTTFLDIQSKVNFSGEMGLLGLAFDPDFTSTGEFYVYYAVQTTGSDSSSARPTRVSRFKASGTTASSSSEEILLDIAQPFSNHKGGMIAFGPDGYLYIGTGDGGSGGDPGNRAQNLGQILGKMLRIDVNGTPDAGLAYKIPPTNPWASGAGGARKEIFAYGLRNPYRWSFDMLNGWLLCGDVGQDAWEEVDHVRIGENYGWNIREGNVCYNATTCSSVGFTSPLAVYSHSLGLAITGGYVYYGSAVPNLYGAYIYADYSSGRVWTMRYDGQSVTSAPTQVADTNYLLTGFGQDKSGEVYLLDYGSVSTGSGTAGAYVLRPTTPGNGGTFPTKLSSLPSLLTAGQGQGHTVPGVLPYDPASDLWSDGMHKTRYAALPGTTQIGWTASNGWTMPDKTVLVKNFSIDLDETNPSNATRPVETRVLYYKDGSWTGYSYEWNDAGTDASLLTNGKLKSYTVINSHGASETFDWEFPNGGDCFRCHTASAGTVLGLQTPEMNSSFTYPSSGVTDNQLSTLDHISIFTAPLPSAPSALPAMVNYADNTQTAHDRARAYLASNCSMCHRPGGGTPAAMNLRFESTDEELNAINVDPIGGNLGIEGAKLIYPGDIEKSLIYRRMTSLVTTERMPPLGSHRVDEQGAEIIATWIESLATPSFSDSWMVY